MPKKKNAIEVILDLLVTLFVIAMSVFGLATMLPYLTPIAKTIVTSSSESTPAASVVERVGGSDESASR